MGFFVLYLRVLELRGLANFHHWEKLRVIALFVSRRPFWECRAPAKIDRLTARGLERKARDIECRCRLPIAKVRHDGSEVGPCDHIEQLLLVDRKPRPDLTQVIDGVDVGDDGVMAGALKPLIMERSARALADNG